MNSSVQPPEDQFNNLADRIGAIDMPMDKLLHDAVKVSIIRIRVMSGVRDATKKANRKISARDVSDNVDELILRDITRPDLPNAWKTINLQQLVEKPIGFSDDKCSILLLTEHSRQTLVRSLCQQVADRCLDTNHKHASAICTKDEVEALENASRLYSAKNVLGEAIERRYARELLAALF